MKITDKEVGIAVQLFNEGMSVTKIAQSLHRDRGTLTKKMKEAGANITQHCNKKNINSNFFDKLNKKNAYWLGFIFADGHLSQDGVFELTIKDKGHLEKLKSDLNSDHKISEKIVNETTYYRISFRDKKISKRLKELGVTHNKTYGWKVPNMPKKLLSHFIRGLYDGDGNLSIRGAQSVFRIVSYDITVLEKIQNIINEQVPCTIGHSRIYIYSNKVPEFNVSKISTLVPLLKWLYKDASVFLERKHIKYLDFLPSKVKR